MQKKKSLYTINNSWLWFLSKNNELVSSHFILNRSQPIRFLLDLGTAEQQPLFSTNARIEQKKHRFLADCNEVAAITKQDLAMSLTLYVYF